MRSLFIVQVRSVTVANACVHFRTEKWGGNYLHCLIASYTPAISLLFNSSWTVVCTRCFHSRGSNPNDPPTVIRAREQEKQIIAKWLQQWNYNTLASPYTQYWLYSSLHSVQTGFVILATSLSFSVYIEESVMWKILPWESEELAAASVSGLSHQCSDQSTELHNWAHSQDGPNRLFLVGNEATYCTLLGGV